MEIPTNEAPGRRQVVHGGREKERMREGRKRRRLETAKATGETAKVGLSRNQVFSSGCGIFGIQIVFDYGDYIYPLPRPVI